MSAPALSNAVNGISQVSGDNLNTYNQTCNIPSDLRAYVGLPGIQVFMRGFVSPGDGGQGQFYWNVSGTGPDDNGVTNIVPTAAAIGCWTRIGGTGGSGVSSVTNFDGSITFSPTTGVVVGSIATGGVKASNIGTGAAASNVGNLSGDLSGTLPNPVVSQINTALLGTTTPTSGNLLIGSGSAWVTNAVAGDGTLSSTGALTVTKTNGASLGTMAVQNASNVNISGGVIAGLTALSAAYINVTGSTPPTTGMYQVSSRVLGFAGSSGVIFTASNIGTTNVNFLNLSSGSTGVFPILAAAGSDTNIGIQYTAKGTGVLAGHFFYSQNGSNLLLSMQDNNNVSVGNAAVATSATSGFLWIPSCPGAATGSATAPYTGAAAIVYDSTDNKIYVRSGGTWRATSALV